MRLAATLVTCLFAIAAHAEETSVMRKMSENKFAAMPGIPACVTVAVESGDPGKGPSVILFKAKAGCVIPWHWHTPTETVMMVSGSATIEMQDKSGQATLGPGGFAMLPSKHVHRFICKSACTAFVSSDAAFDIHYVDSTGKEIPPETALKK